MKMEYLAGGSSDCPLIRLYPARPETVSALAETLASLSNGTEQGVDLHGLNWLEPVRGCELLLRVGTQDIGIRQGRRPSSFECILTPESWLQMMGFLSPFMDLEQGQGYRWQWLDDTGDIKFLLTSSEEGCW